LSGSAQKIQDLVDKYMDAVKPRAQHTAESGAARATDLESMDEAAENAKKAVRKLDAGKESVVDDDELVTLADDASSKVARFNEHVASLLNETEDKELKTKLQAALQALKQDNKDLVSRTNAFVGKDRNEADKAALGAACKKTIRDIDHVMHDIREASKPKTFEDEIEDAALDIQEAVDEYAHVPQEIRDLAMRLAELMRQLAECARKGDRPGIISTSKQISDIIKQIQKYAPLPPRFIHPILSFFKKKKNFFWCV
jgi:DNA repair exonuclease SbcCD ATPase subunit